MASTFAEFTLISFVPREPPSPSLWVNPARAGGSGAGGSAGLSAFLHHAGPHTAPAAWRSLIGAFPQGTPTMATILFSSVQDYTELFTKNVLHLKELSLLTKARRKMSKYKYYHNPSRFLRIFLQCLISLLNSPMLPFSAESF